MRDDAEETLKTYCALANDEFEARHGYHDAELAIEILVRLDSLDVGGGAAYRTKRRFQLAKRHLASSGSGCMVLLLLGIGQDSE